MREVAPGLFVGNERDEQEIRGKDGWAFVHACKEPYHREALGYTERGAPKEHVEYLYAQRGDRLCLNLVDVADPKYVHAEIVNTALDFIADRLAEGKRVLVHCNQGMSRGPSIAFSYLAKQGLLGYGTHAKAEDRFRDLYPDYAPAEGMRGFLRQNWDDLRP